MKNISQKATQIYLKILSIHNAKGVDNMNDFIKENIEEELFELEQAGYLIRTLVLKDNGQFSHYKFHIFEG